MTVLIVDDQINVVSGLMFGIHWDEIGVKKVYKAYNAHEAKEQLERFDIDIVLCDIEMPIENGLSLCAWSREQGFHAEFIFLTAHADFLYAKEAVRLGGFDYVLQPASYEEVARVVAKARAQIESRKRMSVMERCNDMFWKQREILLDRICQEWMTGKNCDWEQIRENLNSLGISIREETEIWCAMICFAEKSEVLKTWQENLIAYVLCNIAKELLAPYDCSCLSRCVQENEYILIIYAEMNGSIVPESLDVQLETLRRQVVKYYEQDFACYVIQCQRKELLCDDYNMLTAMKRDNVEKNRGIFWSNSQVRHTLGNIQISRIVQEWEALLKNHLYDSFAADAAEQLHNMCRRENMNAEILNRFYQEFMRVVYLAADEGGYKVTDIFALPEDLERACNACTSVQNMEWLIEYIHAFFSEQGTSDEQKRTQIDSVLQYIRTHLDQNIRRNNVAEAVHLNPNYVSRLFKSTVGISLKEYILQEKMKLAARFVRETNLPISTVAMKVGYTNFSLFSQTYKRMCDGLTPAEDRKRCRDEKV